MAIPVKSDLDFENTPHIVNYPGGFPPPIPNSKFAVDFGNTTDLGYSIQHNLGTQDLLAQVFTVIDRQLVQADIAFPNPNQISIFLGVPPGVNALRVVILK